MNNKPTRTEAQRRAWGKYLASLQRQHDERRKVARVKAAYQWYAEQAAINKPK